MPSKESLERGRKYNESVHACSCRAIPHNTEMQNFCLSCIALADLLDKAIREAREKEAQDWLMSGTLNEYLLPLLQAGQAMRDHYLETEFWPEESKKEAAAWDAARERLAQLEKR